MMQLSYGTLKQVYEEGQRIKVCHNKVKLLLISYSL